MSLRSLLLWMCSDVRNRSETVPNHKGRGCFSWREVAKAGSVMDLETMLLTDGGDLRMASDGIRLLHVYDIMDSSSNYMVEIERGNTKTTSQLSLNLSFLIQIIISHKLFNGTEISRDQC